MAGCSGGHDDDLGCNEDTECSTGSVCRDGLCVDIGAASIGASADSAGTDQPVPVLVIDGNGVSCELSKCTNLPRGTQVTFRANAAPGYRFTGWTGSPECVGSAADLVIPSLLETTHCIANYVRRVKIAGHTSGAEGGVTATSTSPFASCNGGVCEVDAGQPVQLRANDRFGQRFSGWSGPGCGSAISFETTLSSSSADLVCVANFVERIVVAGEAMNVEAVIGVAADGAVCEPGSCVIDKGGNAILTAPVVPNSRFAGWSGSDACTGAEPVLRLSNIQSSQKCQATYTARVTVSGSASGAEPAPAVSALSSDLYASCSGGSCQTDRGGSVTLLASSASGYRLTGWTGPQCEAEKGAAVMLSAVDSDVACVATYLQGIAVIGAVVGAPGDVSASSTTEAAVCAEGGCVIDLGGNVTLVAPSPPGYRFLGWDGDEGCTSSELTISFPAVTQSKTCYARFATRFLVRGNPVPAEGGTVVASSTSAGAVCEADGCTLDGGGEVLLTITAKDGYRFSGWSGGGACSGSEPSLRVPNIAGNTTCQANFVGRFTVAAISTPPEGGSVLGASDSGAATCTGASCTVDRGSRVSFTATAATGFRFTGWATCSTSSEATITLDGIRADTGCTANFTPLRYTVAGSVAPAASGAVDARATGNNSQCANGACTVNYGSTVTLTATPATGWRFGGWTGCGASDQLSIAVNNVRADATCQATFQRITFVITAGFTPDNGGAVTLNASGPGATCNGLRCTVPYGGSAALVATPANGWSFANWSGCSESTEANLNLANISATADCRATFSRQRFDVTGSVRPADSGSVVASSNAQGASCNGNKCTVNFGSAVTLRATASTGFQFSNWSGCADSTDAALNVRNVTAGTTCQANFTPLRFTVAGSAAPTNGGAVIASANGGNADCAGNRCTVNYGATVALLATPATGYQFTSWSNCPVNGGAAINVANVTVNIACQANFERLTFPVVAVAGTGGVVAVVDSNAATCTGTACTVQYAGAVSFAAAAMTGFEFMGWTGGCTVSADDPSRATAANVTAAVSCTASFTLRSFRVRAVAGTGGSITAASAVGGTCNGATCAVNYGGSASFTAAADVANGYEFVNWTGAGCSASADNPLVANALTVTSNVTCNANFRLRSYTISAVAAGAGTVSASFASAACANASCSVPSGSTVSLLATENGSRFVGWTCNNSTSSTLATLSLTASADIQCTASFAGRTSVTTRVGNATRGTATISGGAAPICNAAATTCTVDTGSSVTLTATPASSAFIFLGWSGCSVASNTASTTLLADANAVCAARFGPANVTLTGVAVGSGALIFDNPVGPGSLAAGSCDSNQNLCVVPNGGGASIFVAVPSGSTYSFSGCTPGVCTHGGNVGNGSVDSCPLIGLTDDTTCTVTFVAPPVIP